MRCGARRASRVIYPEGIPLGWGDGLQRALKKRLMEIKIQKKKGNIEKEKKCGRLKQKEDMRDL